MVMGRPLFCGSNDGDQVNRIFKILGTPGADTWPSMTSMPKYNPALPLYPGKKLSQILPRLGGVGLDLLERLLQPDPGKRVSAREAMKHPYFADLQGVTVQLNPLDSPPHQQLPQPQPQLQPQQPHDLYIRQMQMEAQRQHQQMQMQSLPAPPAPLQPTSVGGADLQLTLPQASFITR